MLIVLYTCLLSYMLFFSICVAPVINNTLDRKNSSILLRKIFPKNFKFGGLVALLAIFASVYYNSLLSFVFSLIILCLFIINLYYLVPKINLASDKVKSSQNYSKEFKKLHLLSVILYGFQMLASLFFIIYLLINDVNV